MNTSTYFFSAYMMRLPGCTPLSGYAFWSGCQYLWKLIIVCIMYLIIVLRRAVAFEKLCVHEFLKHQLEYRHVYVENSSWCWPHEASTQEEKAQSVCTRMATKSALTWVIEAQGLVCFNDFSLNVAFAVVLISNVSSWKTFSLSMQVTSRVSSNMN